MNLINNHLINCCVTVDTIIRSPFIHKFTAVALESNPVNSSQMDTEKQVSCVIIHAVFWNSCY